MKQQCELWSVWLTWLALPVVAVLAGLRLGWPAGVVVLVVGVLAQMTYVRWFPHLSGAMGYGSVGDVAAGAALPAVAPRSVTLYTASACPFCPLVRKRLAQLGQVMRFELQEVDVTFRPDLVRAKGLRSVPVVEVDGRLWKGNATSAELAAFLAGSPPAAK